MIDNLNRRLFAAATLILFTFSAQADVLEDVLERGVIRVGVAAFTPWAMTTEDGELVGSEIDMARKLASDMGVKVEFSMMEWPNLIPAVQNGAIDVISAGMSITPGRALKVNFTRPVARSGIVLTTNTAMTRDIPSLAAPNSPDYTIAVARDTLSHNVAKMLFGDTKMILVSTPADAGKEVVAGRAHAFVSGDVEAQFLVMQHGGVVDIPMNEPLIGYPEAMAVRKGEQEMLNFLNAWIETRSADKWIDTTRSYWFDTMEWAAKVGN